MKRFALAALFFAAATVAMTWPLVTGLPHFLSDPGDPYLNTWILHWDWRAVFHDPLHLFDANIFYPHKLSLAFSENMIGAAVFGFPFYFAGFAPITVYNIVFLLGMFLSGLGAWALAREMTGDGTASLIAGIFYEFVPFRFSHLPHIQMQWGGFLPLALLFLWRFFRTKRSADLVWFSLLFAWNALANVHFGIFGGLAFLLTCAICLTRERLWMSRRVTSRIALALSASLLLIAPIYAPYFVAAHLYHFRRSLGEIAYFSATTLLDAGRRNKLYGRLTARFEAPECQLFFGFLVPLLAIVALLQKTDKPAPLPPESRPKPPGRLDAIIAFLVAMRIALALTGGFRIGRLLSVHDPTPLSSLIFVFIIIRLCLAFPRFLPYRNLGDFLRRTPCHPAIPWALGMTALGILMAFGANLFFYRGLYRLASFALGAIRAPTRAIVLAHLGLGVLAALGLSRMTARRAALRPALLIAACLIGLFEFRAAPLKLYAADPTPRNVSRWLAAHEFSGGVLELPMDIADNIEYVYRVTEHDRPVVNGYSGFFPADFDELAGAVETAKRFAPLLPHLRRSDARLLIFHPNRAAPAESHRLASVLTEGVSAGHLSPIALAEDPSDLALVFELMPTSGIFSREFRAPSATRSRILAILESPLAFGCLDFPSNNQTHAARSIQGSGWAACDLGIARISILLDEKKAGEADYGGFREDVLRHFPNIPCRDRCGFSFTLPNVSPGPHRLEVRLRDGGGRFSTLAAVQIHIASPK
jgi:hypothetical protein